MTEKETGVENGKVDRIIVIVIILFGIAVMAGIYLYKQSKQPATYPYTLTVAGVNVYSKIPISEFQNKKRVFLFETQDKIATTCNFEISAVSTPDREGYKIHMERKPVGIYLDKNSAHILGETDEELLKACHAFLCLREGMECPENLMEIRDIVLNSKNLIIVRDSRLGSSGIMGHTELLGVLGYIQAQILNTEGMNVWIYPFVVDVQTNLCTLQPFSNAIQTLNITDNTTECKMNSGIFLIRSKENGIWIEGKRVFISGDDEHIRIGSIIVRDILSPEWIRVYYGLE